MEKPEEYKSALNIQKGITQPPTVNPDVIKRLNRGRKKKYSQGTKIVSLSLSISVLERIEEQAKEHNKPLSTFICDILDTATQNDYQYAEMMAKKYARKLNYWIGEKARLQDETTRRI